MRPLSLAIPTLTLVLTSCAGVTEPTDIRPEAARPQAVWNGATKVGEIVAARPGAARIFDLIGIDYCCGGQSSLREAATAKKVDVTALLRALEAVGGAAHSGSDRDWQQAPLGDLMDHIVATHHAWLRRELPPLVATARTVLKVHGSDHPELREVVAIIDKVHASVLPHLDDEEQRVFPALRQMVQGRTADGVPALLEELQTDHDELGGELHRLRSLTRGFAVPEGACVKYRAMLSGLSELERDMHTHVHLENNVLLPRARALLSKSR